MGSQHVRAGLDRSESYDALDGADQSLVRAEWDRRMSASADALDLAAGFRAADVDGWVESDPTGNVVIHHA